jgi:demethoxyubiquinone hydroxylase (CLK1/Coq7/Cat5 family)
VKLTEMFTLDHSARKGKNIDWNKLSAEDRERRKEVHRMLDAGEVRMATDYEGQVVSTYSRCA